MFADLRCSPSCTRAGVHGTVALCPPDCFQYKRTRDVFYKIIRQERIARLWRGTNARLALAVPTVGIYLSCYDIFRNRLEEFTAQNTPILTPYAHLVAGALARSLACISCYPIGLAKTRMQVTSGDYNLWNTLGKCPIVATAKVWEVKWRAVTLIDLMAKEVTFCCSVIISGFLSHALYD